ncbi:TetR/AcrR family transcriptional regulator [Saccharothrix sp. ST-888]|uniref:TetR/AcrR family transcriptional regulator n=1 Tax=Saccharothrix sp. ST-888 TaxID=1427391 RepID=UPI0005ECDCB0|nr:TetR family transcriptional regulator [Saccharothrix sp. ST-888]KJK55369.1 TetR family transcriptional regulator [Saccharothrix sp. ST-888]
MNKTRGRPRGNPPTRARIAEAARELFVEHGYRGTTLRAVAAAAGVDQALISYHFGSKQGLFGEVTQVQCARALDLAGALRGDPAGLPDRLLRAVTDLWDDTDLNRLAMHGEDVMQVFREYLEREVLGRIAEYLGGPDATERALAAVTVLGGLIFTRYLNPLPASAQLDSADVRRILAPTLRAALQSRTTRIGRPGRPVLVGR